MKDSERAVLRLLADHYLWLSARDISRNIQYDSGYVRTICKNFEAEDILEIDDTSGGPFYRITDRGRAYLSGNLDEDS